MIFESNVGFWLGFAFLLCCGLTRDLSTDVLSAPGIVGGGLALPHSHPHPNPSFPTHWVTDIDGKSTAGLPYVDMVIIVTNPWRWSHRRGPVAQAFIGSLNRTRHTAKLLFVMGDDETPAELSDMDKALFSHPSVGWVNVPHCKDYDDKGWPGAWDGVMFPPVNSSTTCKVLGGAAYAVEHYRFRYFARSGDDSYLRWEYFLEERTHDFAHEWLMLGNFNPKQHVFDHLFNVFGKGRFPPYATGQGYIMTWDVANYLRVGYKAGKTHFTTAGPEDAAIALVLLPINVHNLHTGDFHDPYKRACSKETILIHYVTKEMWESIDDKGVIYCAKLQKPGGRDDRRLALGPSTEIVSAEGEQIPPNGTTQYD